MGFSRDLKLWHLDVSNLRQQAFVTLEHVGAVFDTLESLATEEINVNAAFVLFLRVLVRYFEL